MSNNATLGKKEVAHVAKLAALTLADDEIERLTADLKSILGHVAELDALDTSSVEPTSQVQLERSAWRNDAILPGVDHDEALAQAPRAEHGGFAVPTFVES